MTKLQILSVAICLGALSLPAQAEVLDLNLNNDAVFGQFTGPLAHAFPNALGEYQFGGMYSDDHNDHLTTLNAGFLMTGDAGAEEDVRLRAGVGLRGQYTSLDHYSGGGGALGGQFDLRFAGFERLGLQGYLWYQPKVLSLGDLNGQFEFAIDADYQILRNASVYVGYRRLSIKPEDHGSFTADDGAHIGMRFTF